MNFMKWCFDMDLRRVTTLNNSLSHCYNIRPVKLYLFIYFIYTCLFIPRKLNIFTEGKFFAFIIFKKNKFDALKHSSTTVNKK